MTVYRLSKQKYCYDLSGKGAELIGRRWNSKGTAMLYTSSSRALCVTELAVHLPLGIVPKDFYLVTIEIPDSCSIYQLKEEDLPPNWNAHPHSHFTQVMGDKFANTKKHIGMSVPSAAVQGDYNYLINPHHKDFQQIKITQATVFTFDDRLFKP